MTSKLTREPTLIQLIESVNRKYGPDAYPEQVKKIIHGREQNLISVPYQDQSLPPFYMVRSGTELLYLDPRGVFVFENKTADGSQDKEINPISLLENYLTVDSNLDIASQEGHYETTSTDGLQYTLKKVEPGTAEESSFIQKVDEADSKSRDLRAIYRHIDNKAKDAARSILMAGYPEQVQKLLFGDNSDEVFSKITPLPVEDEDQPVSYFLATYSQNFYIINASGLFLLSNTNVADLSTVVDTKNLVEAYDRYFSKMIDNAVNNGGTYIEAGDGMNFQIDKIQPQTTDESDFVAFLDSVTPSFVMKQRKVASEAVKK